MEKNAKENQIISNPQIKFSWVAPARAYKKKSDGVLRFYFAIALMMSVVVALFGDWILILPIVASVFLFYALTITPPDNVDYKLTRFGIEIHGLTYRFDDLAGFYVIKKFDYFVVTALSHSPFFNRIYLVVEDEMTLHKVVKILSDHLVFIERPEKTVTDKLAGFLSDLMPGDGEETTLKQTKLRQNSTETPHSHQSYDPSASNPRQPKQAPL